MGPYRFLFYFVFLVMLVLKPGASLADAKCAFYGGVYPQIL